MSCLRYFNVVLQTSGLSEWLGCQLQVLDTIPKAALVFICGAVMTMFTEFTSNTSSASIFLPILAQLVSSVVIGISYILGAQHIFFGRILLEEDFLIQSFDINLPVILNDLKNDT